MINTTREDEELKEGLKRDVLKRLFSCLLAYKSKVITVICLILATVGMMIAYPLLIQHVIDDVIVDRDTKGLWTFMGICIGLALANFVCTILWRRIMARVSNEVVLNLRQNLYEHIQCLGLDFFDSRPAGKILARVTGDVNALKDVLSSGITQFIPEVVTVVAVFAVMLCVSPLLTLCAVAAFPFIIVGVFLCEILAHKRWQLLRKKESNMSAFIHENIAGISVIQSFGAVEESKKEFDEIVDDHRNSFFHAVLCSDLFSPTVEVSYCVGGFLIYLVAIRVLHVDAASVGTLVAFMSYLGMFFGPVRNLANFYNKLITNISAAERVFEIMDTEPLVRDEDGAVELPDPVGKVEFKNVDFAYPDEPDKAVLQHVDFLVKPGETVALVGPTGAGKTTIVSLLCRFYNTTGGQVFIDDHDIRTVTVHSLREKLGIMTQDNYLFSGTIAQNIRYGRPDASMEEIVAAAKAVHVHDFILSLPKGYDTVIEERGGGLSIGQRQLIAFARTLVSNPGILILDEATSNIDTGTEILIQQGIEELLKNRTSFVVAHRLSTIRNADRIFVIDGGGIEESGSHEELMERQGAYYRLYTAQQ